jgi:nicotinamidase-related amidase
MLELVPRYTALVAIDLQNWTLGMPLTPHPAAQVTSNSVQLAEAIRSSGGLVILTRAAFSPGYADMLRRPVDIELKIPPGGIPEQGLAFHPSLDAISQPLIITKRQWSAFHGTELDLQLRRREIRNVVVTGIMTNFGVESTARDAWQSNYAVVVAEDACSSLGDGAHGFSMANILPRVARVRSTADIVEAIRMHRRDFEA